MRTTECSGWTAKAFFFAVAFLSAVITCTAAAVDYNDISQYYGFDDIEIIKLDWDIKNLRVADFNGDGRNDIIVVNNRKARIEILIQKAAIGPEEESIAVDPQDADINAITAPTRFQRHSVPVSENIFSLVCGDLNSDQMPDLAFYAEPKGLYVILQKTPETTAPRSDSLLWHSKKKFRIEDGLRGSDSLVCADLNNDGRRDLALAGQKDVYVIVQKQDGTLAEPVKYPAAETILGIEAPDLNGDNVNDLVLVTADPEKPLHVRFGTAAGQLGPQIRFALEKPAVLEFRNIDDKTGCEILTVDAISRRLIGYRFSDEKLKDSDWPILFYPLPSGPEYTQRDLVLGDFDGDGLTDVIISDGGAAELIFYRQTAGFGLAEPVRFPAFSGITSIAAEDIDGDRKAELAVLSVEEKLIGIAEFDNDRLCFPKPVDLTGEPVGMELADVDNNGGIDCLYISRDVNDLRSLQVIYDFHSKAAKRGTPETSAGPKLDKLASNPEGMKCVDVDQDGLQDLLIFVRYDSPILIRQTRKRHFEVVDSPASQASLIKDAGLRSIAVADVDGKKGRELLLAQKNFARSLIFADGGKWQILDQYNAASTDNKICAVGAFHIDPKTGTSQPDILLLDGQNGRLQILKAAADGTYRFETELDVGRWSVATHMKMLFARLTGNTENSILLFDSEKFAIITVPTGRKSPAHLEQLFGYETKIKDGAYGNVTAGDINADGCEDIIMVEHKNNHIEILALDSQLKPVPAMRFKVFEEKSYRGSKDRDQSRVEPRELKAADVTGDGKADLITIIHDRIIIYPQD